MRCAICPCGHAAAVTSVPFSQHTPAAAGPCQHLRRSGGRTHPGRQQGRSIITNMSMSGTDPSALQDLIVGGAMTAAVGAALYSGLKREPVPCDLCAGNGGIRCFACQGSSLGVSDQPVLSSTDQQRGRGVFAGRGSGKASACRVCKGTGLVMCSKCRGTGYITKF